jgi:transposase
MNDANDNKRRQLQEAGLLHGSPDNVSASLFREYPDFFDARDLLQVRYELLRAHLVDGGQVLSLCQRYGISRQTFYTLLEKFTHAGTVGLLPERRGPHGPSKLTDAVVTYVREALQEEPELSGATLAARLQARFELSIHKRTAERLLQRLRIKINS